MILISIYVLDVLFVIFAVVSDSVCYSQALFVLVILVLPSTKTPPTS